MLVVLLIQCSYASATVYTALITCLEPMKNVKRAIGYVSAVVLVSAFVVVFSHLRGTAQSCANFWVNPQTGAQECLDRLAPPVAAPENSPGGSATSPGSGSSGGSGGGSKPGIDSGRTLGTVSSDEVNRQYANQRFSMASENQMQTRLPILSNLPQSDTSAATHEFTGEPGVAPAANTRSQPPRATGTAQVSFTGSRVLGGTTNPAQAEPYRMTGKLYMAFGGTTFNEICSASMIGRSLLLTAAHCVHRYGQGANGFARKVRFVPAQDNLSQPYGFFESTQFLIPTVYFNGTDTCSTRGVVCNNDIALVALGNNSAGQQAGDRAGYYGYGWNNFGFATPASSFQSVFGNKPFVALTQLGYPGSHDSGGKMQINTAYGGYYLSGNLKNTWLGSAMTGGSSGGPWLVNLGISATGADYGNSNNRNVVVGVTSWGYIDGVTKVQGSSSFGQNLQFPNATHGSRGAGNIGKLVFDACDSTDPALSAWRLQSKGRCR